LKRFVVALIASVIVTLGAATQGTAYSVNVRHARAYARAHVNRGQWPCLHKLWDNESGWAVHARTGRAYGIPQAYPGKRMRSAGADWRTSGRTQVKWGLNYIRGRYGTPCHALTFQDRNGYY
jgi:hypothetical protein